MLIYVYTQADNSDLHAHVNGLTYMSMSCYYFLGCTTQHDPTIINSHNLISSTYISTVKEKFCYVS